MRVRGRVEEHAVRAARLRRPRFGEPIADLALVVRLLADDRRAELLCARFQARVDLGERLFAVNRRLARAEKLEVRPRDAEDARAAHAALPADAPQVAHAQSSA